MSGATKWVGSIAALLIGTPAWSESKPAKKPKAVQEATEPAVETRNEGPKKEEPRRLFPNWPTPAFGLSVRPLIGYQSATTRKGDGSVTKASTLEAGLAGAVQGIPVMPGNPGFYLAPELGFAVGNVKADIRATNGVKTTDNSKYQRIWGDVDLIGYFHFYRHTLGLGRGEKQYSGDSDLRIRSTTIRNDLAILALDWFSTHLTHTFVRAYYTSFSDPFIQESDLWLHGNMFFDFLSFHLDSGPGSTIVDEYIDDAAGHRIGHAAGRSDYLRADMALRIIWKLGVSGSAKYVGSISFSTTPFSIFLDTYHMTSYFVVEKCPYITEGPTFWAFPACWTDSGGCCVGGGEEAVQRDAEEGSVPLRPVAQYHRDGHRKG